MNLRPWSFTKLKAFETCLRQGNAKYLTKELPYVDNEALRHGREIHKMMEDYINDGADLPAEHLWLAEYVPLHSTDTKLLQSEVGLGIYHSLTNYNNPSGFSDRDSLFIGKLDVLNIEGDTGFIIDWKTGRPWEDADELQLHAMLAKAHYPDVQHWRGGYMWVKEKRMGDLHKLYPGATYWALLKRIKVVEDALEQGFIDRPTKNKLCDWCAVERCQFFTGAKL